MQIKQFYTICTGYCHKENRDTKIDWYDSLRSLKTKDGYFFHLCPFDYPVYTTFEEADQTCRSNWNDLMYENHDNYAKVCEYIMSPTGIWRLCHEWIYSIEEDYTIKIPIQNEKGVYKLFSELIFPEEGEVVEEKVYKDVGRKIRNH